MTNVFTIAYVLPDGVLGSLLFDALLTETPQFTATSTQHPVETGVSISDHYRRNLDKLSIEAVITMTPHVEKGGVYPGPTRARDLPFTLTTHSIVQTATAKVEGGRHGAILRKNGGPHTPITVTPGQFTTYTNAAGLGGTSVQYATEIGRVEEMFLALNAIMDRGDELDIFTAYRNYPRMLLVSLGAPRTVQDSIVFSMEFEEFRRAEVSVVKVKKRLRPAQKRAKSTAAAGTKGTPFRRTSEIKGSSQRKSFALRGYAALGE